MAGFESPRSRCTTLERMMQSSYPGCTFSWKVICYLSDLPD